MEIKLNLGFLLITLCLLVFACSEDPDTNIDSNNELNYLFDGVECSPFPSLNVIQDTIIVGESDLGITYLAQTLCDTIFLDETNNFSTPIKDYTTYSAQLVSDSLFISWTKVGIASFESCNLTYIQQQ